MSRLSYKPIGLLRSFVKLESLRFSESEFLIVLFVYSLKHLSRVTTFTAENHDRALYQISIV